LYQQDYQAVFHAPTNLANMTPNALVIVGHQKHYYYSLNLKLCIVPARAEDDLAWLHYTAAS